MKKGRKILSKAVAAIADLMHFCLYCCKSFYFVYFSYSYLKCNCVLHSVLQKKNYNIFIRKE